MKKPRSSLEWLEELLTQSENERLEFKEAKRNFDSEKLTQYCVALANEGGGYIILGVSDKKPRKIVGSDACRNLDTLKKIQGDRVKLRIDAEEVQHPDGRVVIITVPSRPIGTPVHYKGAYWMRRGESLVGMGPETIKEIINESQPDYSAQICPGATMDHLDPEGVEKLRELWFQSSKNEALLHISAQQLLEDAELTIDGELTYAALILLGSHSGLGRYLAQAETIFEYRSSEASVSHQQRREFRKGFLLYLDELWELIALRNEIHSYREGLFRRDIPTFNEEVIREGLLNALAHRDYRLGGSIFVRQYPKALEIVSPGGFPPGITIENLLERQLPRNRRVAEVLAKCNLVERSGQGADRIFKIQIQESKALPDYSASDDYQVSLRLNGEVRDARFLTFLERIGQETLTSFTTSDFLVIDAVHRGVEINPNLRPRLPKLMDLGVLEKKGRGRGTRYLLSERFYQFTDDRGTYTRLRGLDKEVNKQLLYEHILRNRGDGSPARELQQVLPTKSRDQIYRLMNELREEGKVSLHGRGSSALWYPSSADD